MPVYVRVRDDSTGHEYDCDKRSLRPGMTPIEGYPINSGLGARPRRPKHHVAKDGKPAPRRRKRPAAPDSAPSATSPEGAESS